MNVLVLGNGGREHALAWKLKKSPLKPQVFLHPGNAGTLKSGLANLGDVPMSPETITQACALKTIELVVIGPEVLLAAGYADHFRKAGLLVVGPGQAGAQLESSKIFAKDFMRRAGIPTAFSVTIETDIAFLAMSEERKTWPVVAKLDGLAAGKGVVVAETPRELEDFATRIWVNKEFGPGPHRILVEDFISGRELSYIGLCDGNCFLPLATSTDYKRVADYDHGANTGGMGCISPSPFETPELMEKIRTRITEPLLNQFKKEAMDYRGALYIGIMIDEKKDPYVLEFNARFGDPETQVLMLRLESDLLPVLMDTARAQLAACPLPQSLPGHSVYVVAAAAGYPASPQLGDTITGLETLKEETQVFFSGVKDQNGILATAGGRVLGVGSTGPSLAEIRERLYRELRLIHWNGIHFRNDIGG